MNSKQLREQRAALIQGMDAIVTSAQAEGRTLNSEESVQFDKIDAEAIELRNNIDRIEKVEAAKKEIAAKQEQRADAPQKVESRAAFAKYLRSGMGSLNSEERRSLETRGTDTQIVGTDSLGGYLVPEDFSNILDVASKFTGVVEQVSQVINTNSGSLLPYPTVDDTSVSGAILSEATAPAVSDMTFSAVNLNAYNYSSGIVKVSRQLLQDGAFNLDAFLVDALGGRIARGTNASFTTGTGSSQPKGVVVGSAAGKTAASATAVTAAEILDLMYSVDPSYRNAASAGFMMKDSTLAAVRKLGLGSANDFPIFVPAMNPGEKDMLYGKPIHINNDMAAIATTAKSILFGDFSKFVVRVAGGLQFLRLDERFADALIVGYIAYKRVDSNILQANAIKHLVQA
jgi:HK97 family phage major capsid protein|tara:strand:- start:452 stop:1651 length:1200 start_codon:yes stop_codon:yes gene_type:complete